MKNKFPIILVFTLLFTGVLSCGSNNKTGTNKGVDVTVGDERTGVPECDEALDMIAAAANDPDESFVTKAAKAVFLNKVKDAVRQSVEDNKGDKEKLAENCREFRDQLVKFKAQEDKKKNQ